MQKGDLENSPQHRLFCKDIVLISHKLLEDPNVKNHLASFRFSTNLGMRYTLFSNDPPFENEHLTCCFTGFAIEENEFIKSGNFFPLKFETDMIGNYLYIEYDKILGTISVKNDFYSNALRFVYENQKQFIFSNNLLFLYSLLHTSNIDIVHNFENINFNLDLAIEVAQSNNYLSYFNQYNLEKPEIMNLEFVEPFSEFTIDANDKIQFLDKEIIEYCLPLNEKNPDSLDLFISLSKQEMLNVYQALRNEFEGYEFCSDLTAGADSRCLLSFFLENNIDDILYHVELKGKNSVAAIGLTDAYYFQYFCEQFKLTPVNLTKYITDYYTTEEFSELEEYFFARNPFHYWGIPNLMKYENLFLFRGGFGEVYRNYANKKSDDELTAYLSRFIQSKEILDEVFKFLEEKYGRICSSRIEQHNLNYIFYRLRETVVYNKLNYPFYNLLQTKNLLRARQHANLLENNLEVLNKLFINELKKVNINDKKSITNDVFTDEIQIDSLYDLAHSNISIQKSIEVKKNFGQSYYFEKLKSEIKDLIFFFKRKNLDTEKLNFLLDIIQNSNDLNDWRTKNLYYRIKLISSSILKNKNNHFTDI